MSDLTMLRAGDAIVEKTLEVQSEYRDRPFLARLLGISPLGEDARPWYWGVLGERAVGRELERLGPEWTVLHSVPFGSKDSDIDHVVIGPAGVFTVNTKNHSGQNVWVAGTTFLVAGHRTNHIRNTRHEFARAGKLMSAAASTPITARGVIVVVEPRKLTIKEAPDDVTVVTASRLVRWLRKQPTVFTPEQAAWVVDAARRPQTWSAKAPTEVDRRALRDSFERLHNEIGAAKRVRMSWVLGFMASIVTFLLTGGPGLVSPVIGAVLEDLVLP